MPSAENLASIEAEGRRLGIAARKDPDRAVPQYPGWSLRDLAAHTGSIHGRTDLIVTSLPMERVSSPKPPEGSDVVDWYEENLESMLTALCEADPDARCWGFVTDSTVAFWERRMVIETGVHRWDAYQALGEADRLTDLVARNGLDEFAAMWLPRLGDVRPIRVTAVDLGRAWSFGEDPDHEVTGTASDIYLKLMSRPSPVLLPEDWDRAVAGLEPPPKL